MNIKCPKCSQEYDVTEDFLGKEAECPKCGCSFIIENPKLTKCPACERIVSREALTCPHCGQPISIKKETSNKGSIQPDESKNIQSFISDKDSSNTIPSIHNCLSPVRNNLEWRFSNKIERR